jgi:aminopeptidase N
LPSKSRAQLLNDAFELALTNQINSKDLFRLIGYLPNEDDHLPWSIAINKLGYLKSLLDSTSIYGQFSSFLSNLVAPVYARLGGWNENKNETWFDK